MLEPASTRGMAVGDQSGHVLRHRDVAQHHIRPFQHMRWRRNELGTVVCLESVIGSPPAKRQNVSVGCDGIDRRPRRLLHRPTVMHRESLVASAAGGQANVKTGLVWVNSNASRDSLTWQRHLCEYAKLACETGPVREHKARADLEAMTS